MPRFIDILEEIDNILSVPDDELTEEQKAAFEAYADELAQQEAEKVDAFSQFVRSREAKIEYLRQEARAFTNAARAIENKLDRLKAHYQRTMQEHGLKKVSGNVFTLSIRATAIADVDESQLPEQWWNIKTTRTPAKADILRALKRGEEVPGATISHSYSLLTKAG